MSELELALVALGRELDVPRAPDLTAAVHARIAHRRRARWLVPVVVSLLVAIGVAFAVPGARSSILRFFHLRGAEVTIVDRLPAVPHGPLSLGQPTTLGALGFRALLPNGEKPDAVYLAPGGVWLRYGSARQPRLLLGEFLTGGPGFLKKVAAEGATVEYVRVGRDLGIWIEGARHVVYLPGGAARLADETLLWQHGELTLRLEGKLSRAQAIALAVRIR